MKKFITGMFVAVFSIILCLGISAAEFTKSRTYGGNFTDVKSDSWYAGNVASVYEIGLMEGVTANTFDTESEMSVSQAITIAARLHSIYNDTEIPEVTGGRWFQKYVDYCINKGIMTSNQFDSYSRSVLSYEMVELFAAALPKEYYPAINSISYIQDVPPSLDFADDVLLFYKAGVLNGNDKYGTFLPMSAITRKRAAVILSRTALPDSRLTFSLGEKRETYSMNEVLKILEGETTANTLDSIHLVSAGSYNVSAAEYRYYSFIHGNDKAAIEKEIKNSAARYKIMNDQNLEISYDDLSDILAIYYTARSESYGNFSYFDALENQHLTDSVYAKLITLNELFHHAIITEYLTISTDDVYNYAVNNNYICAKHILISNTTPDAYRLALEVRLALVGGQDFDSLLQKYGEDPGMTVRKNGYFFTKGEMVEPFEKAAFALKEGEISYIVETDYGYHIIVRMPFDKNAMLASPDYSKIQANAGNASIMKKLEEIPVQITLKYVDNFDGLADILK